MGLGPFALGRESGLLSRLLFICSLALGRLGPLMGSLPEWNRTAIQRLIADAKDALSLLDGALSVPDFEIRMRALRNGRQDRKNIEKRVRSFLLTPSDLETLDRLIDQIKSRLRFLRGNLL